MEYKLALLFALVCALAGDLTWVQGCTDWPPHIREPTHTETDEQKVYYSEYVVFGKTGSTKKEPYPYANVNGVRTVVFDVRCVYKTPAGMTVPKQIKVTGVGNKNSSKIPGCPPAPLDKEQTAVLFLRKLTGDGQPEDLYEIEFKPISDRDVDDSQKLDDLTLSCGINRTYPEGGVEDEICYEQLGEPDCSPYIVKTPAPVTTPAATTPMVTEAPENTPEPNPEGEDVNKGNGEDVGKPITPNNDNTYNTEAGKSSDGSKGSSATVYLSKSLVILLPVLFVLA